MRNKLIDDIILRVTKGKPSDDLELERSQISHWIDIFGNDLLREYLNAVLGKNERIPASFIIRESCVEAVKEDSECEEDCYQRIVFELSGKPIDLMQDRGIIRVQDNKGREVLKTTVADLGWIKDLPFAKPNKDNLVYHREGKKIVITGYSKKNLFNVEFLVFYVPVLSGEEELNMSDDLISELTLRIEEIAFRQLKGEQDLENDGVQ